MKDLRSNYHNRDLLQGLVFDLGNIEPSMMKLISQVSAVPENHKIARIKIVRENTGMDLKPAKELVEHHLIPFVERNKQAEIFASNERERLRFQLDAHKRDNRVANKVIEDRNAQISNLDDTLLRKQVRVEELEDEVRALKKEVGVDEELEDEVRALQKEAEDLLVENGRLRKDATIRESVIDELVKVQYGNDLLDQEKAEQREVDLLSELAEQSAERITRPIPPDTMDLILEIVQGSNKATALKMINFIKNTL